MGCTHGYYIVPFQGCVAQIRDKGIFYTTFNRLRGWCLFLLSSGFTGGYSFGLVYIAGF